MGKAQQSLAGMRVCHVFCGTEGGTWVFDQLEALQRDHGCDVYAVLGGASGTLHDRCVAAGIKVKPVDFGFRLRRPDQTLRRIFELARWLRRERIEVVQSHVLNSTLMARPAAWLADVPVRLTMVTSPMYMETPLWAAFERWTCRIETGIIPSCHLTAELYRNAGVPEALIADTLYYGPSTERFDPARHRAIGLRRKLGLPGDAPLIASVAYFYGRIASNNRGLPAASRGRMHKGHDDLIAAMPFILEEFPEARMLFVGEGFGPHAAANEAEIRDLIAAAGMEDRVLLTGFVDDVPGIYSDIDVSVQASHGENLGGTIESLLMACPTVATRVGGMVDSVVDGETGVLVAPSDPADLARGIRELLRDPVRAKRLGAAGRARMLAHFTLERTVPRLAMLYSRQRRTAAGRWRLSRFAWRFCLAPLRFLPMPFAMWRTLNAVDPAGADPAKG